MGYYQRSNLGLQVPFAVDSVQRDQEVDAWDLQIRVVERYLVALAVVVVYLVGLVHPCMAYLELAVMEFPCSLSGEGRQLCYVAADP